MNNRWKILSFVLGLLVFFLGLGFFCAVWNLGTEQEVITKEVEVEVESEVCKTLKYNDLVLRKIIDLQSEKLNVGAEIVGNFQYYTTNAYAFEQKMTQLNDLNEKINYQKGRLK